VDADAPTCLVVFVGDTQVPWLRLLRPGFRHCFVALVRRDRWLVLDSLKGHVETDMLPVPADFPLARFYRARGFRVVVPAPAPAPASTRLRLGPLTCVELTKRLVGLAAPAVLTPWQLYRALLTRGGRELLVGAELVGTRTPMPGVDNRELIGI
jgi:hypothetical protein